MKKHPEHSIVTRRLISEALEKAAPLVRQHAPEGDWGAFQRGELKALRDVFHSFADGAELPPGAYDGLEPQSPAWAKACAHEVAELALKAVVAAEDRKWALATARVEALWRVIDKAHAA